jgi:hypothetical protein
MDFVDPPIDFAALARSLGVRAHRIDKGMSSTRLIATH